MRREEHPAREAIQKLTGSYTLTAVVEEDKATLNTMKHVDGMIAFLCTLTKEGRIISQGRGSSVLGPNNRLLTRSINFAFNSSVADAFIRSTKVLDTFRINVEESGTGVALGEAYRADSGESTPATLRQLEYLKQLLQVADEEVRDKWMPNLDTLTKSEASQLIQQYATK